MYAHALAHLVANLHRLTPRHAALVRLWHGVAEARGLTAGQAKAVLTVYERFTGEQGEYAMDDKKPLIIVARQESDGGWTCTAVYRGQKIAVYDNVSNEEALRKVMSLAERIRGEARINEWAS